MAQSKRKQPEQQAPPVQKLRVRYAKRGRARFTSHRDFGRAFERALRRAEIPMAYSSGFNPHPRVSFANAAPTGAATEAEYLEIGVAARCQPDLVRDELDRAMPPGLAVVAVVESTAGSLADELTASRWVAGWQPFDTELTRTAVAAFLAADQILVERMTKHGIREFDARAAVAELSVEDGPEQPARLMMLCHHQTPLVRPDDVLQAMSRAYPDFTAPAGALLTRLSQGRLTAEGLVEPF